VHHVVTTMNAAGWEQHGRRMAESFLARWRMPLTVYAEDFDPDLPVEVRRLPEWQAEFKARHSATAAYVGKYRGGYDFRFDLVKFSHKIAALTDFGLSVDDGVMIWLDADTYTHADVDEDWLRGLFPEPAYIAWLDRQGSTLETGFVMFRASHPRHCAFMEKLQEVYVTDKVCAMREWHDAFVIGEIGRRWEALGRFKAVSLSGGDTRWHHPFVNGPLGSRMDHMKGSRKSDGRSNVRGIDLRRPRKEAYWTA
jgi:hypothetical protein